MASVLHDFKYHIPLDIPMTTQPVSYNRTFFYMRLRWDLEDFSIPAVHVNVTTVTAPSPVSLILWHTVRPQATSKIDRILTVIGRTRGKRWRRTSVLFLHILQCFQLHSLHHMQMHIRQHKLHVVHLWYHNMIDYLCIHKLINMALTFLFFSKHSEPTDKSTFFIYVGA